MIWQEIKYFIKYQLKKFKEIFVDEFIKIPKDVFLSFRGEIIIIPKKIVKALNKPSTWFYYSSLFLIIILTYFVITGRRKDLVLVAVIIYIFFYLLKEILGGGFKALMRKETEKKLREIK